MCNPTPEPPNLLDEHPAVPVGHSIAAHRAFGWCSHCKDHGPAEEVVAWRTRANREQDARQATLAASGPDHRIDLRAVYERPCPSCGREGLTVVTVTLVEGRIRRHAGGWAYCTECDHVPAACYCQPGDAPYLAVPVPTEEATRG
ncbi:hypothetical protein ACFV27_00935 [Streptomyces antimycoticus]|uniref:hypothetical protein n=1 Tax=Streptomyces antimycoticus TaxID=68175 RepID=UPI0036A583C4